MTTLLVASTGGHLVELLELAERMNTRGGRLWITFGSEQSRTLLKGERKLFLPFIAERDVVGVLRGMRLARRIMRAEPIAAVISTGSAIALSFLPYAALRKVEAHYVESATRLRQPSLTGLLLQKVPGVHLYRQYPHADGGRWRYGGSVFDGFRATSGQPKPVRHVVVTLGSVTQSFRRLIARLVSILPPDADVLWQTGYTPVDDLGITARPFVTPDDLSQAMHTADVVIAHGGCGSALAALKAGKYPVLVPRDPHRNELIDGHQPELTGWLSVRDLALERHPEDLTFGDLAAAAARTVTRVASPPPFHLSRA